LLGVRERPAQNADMSSGISQGKKSGLFPDRW
jgi:hypothetical protein